jgi:hypothetical protein
MRRFSKTTAVVWCLDRAETRPEKTRPVEGKRGRGSSDPVRERRFVAAGGHSAQPHGQQKETEETGDKTLTPGEIEIEELGHTAVL